MPRSAPWLRCSQLQASPRRPKPEYRPSCSRTRGPSQAQCSGVKFLDLPPEILERIMQRSSRYTEKNLSTEQVWRAEFCYLLEKFLTRHGAVRDHMDALGLLHSSDPDKAAPIAATPSTIAEMLLTSLSLLGLVQQAEGIDGVQGYTRWTTAETWCQKRAFDLRVYAAVELCFSEVTQSDIMSGVHPTSEG